MRQVANRVSTFIDSFLTLRKSHSRSRSRSCARSPRLLLWTCPSMRKMKSWKKSSKDAFWPTSVSLCVLCLGRIYIANRKSGLRSFMWSRVGLMLAIINTSRMYTRSVSILRA